MAGWRAAARKEVRQPHRCARVTSHFSKSPLPPPIETLCAHGIKIVAKSPQYSNSTRVTSQLSRTAVSQYQVINCQNIIFVTAADNVIGHL